MTALVELPVTELVHFVYKAGDDINISDRALPSCLLHMNVSYVLTAKSFRRLIDTAIYPSRIAHKVMPNAFAADQISSMEREYALFIKTTPGISKSFPSYSSARPVKQAVENVRRPFAANYGLTPGDWQTRAVTFSIRPAYPW